MQKRFSVFDKNFIASENTYDAVSDAFVYESDDNDKKVITVQILPDENYLKETLGDDYDCQNTEKIIDDIIKDLNSKMASYKAIKKVIVRKEDFVRTTTKKIKRAENINYVG